VKDETGKHSTVEENPSIKANNSVINSPKLIANLFNTYFLTAVEKLNNVTNSPVEEEAIQYMTKTIPGTFPDINLLPTMANEIKNIINSLKSRNSCGYDGISTKLFKTCSDYISVPLSYLCNQSLIKGTFPE
jgi:hypothetical protein